MRLPQFSLKALAGIVACAAVACCSLVYASNTWSATIYTAAIVFLAFATLAAVNNRGRARASWAGCASCGGLYLLLVFGPLSSTQQMTSPGQLNVDSELATTHLARWLYASVLPKLRTPPPVTPQTVKLKFTTADGKVSVDTLDMVAVTDVSGFISEINARGITPTVAAPYYPDETSFVRVSHALWTWLFSMAGGIAGGWLHTKQAANSG